MTQARVPRILPEATASGPGRSSWLASAPPIGLALLAVLYAWISGMTLLGDALLILIKVAAALLAVAWAAAALPRRFGRGSRPRAVVAALAIFGFGAAGAVWMFPGVWIIPPVPLALPTLGIADTIPAAYIARARTRLRRRLYCIPAVQRIPAQRCRAIGATASPPIAPAALCGCENLVPPCLSTGAVPPRCRRPPPNPSNCGSPSPLRPARMPTRRPRWRRRR